MTLKKFLILVGVLALAACEPAPPADPNAPSVEFSEETLALLPPGQDLRNVVLQDDNCYWYLHSGPVEDTYIPLLTAEGRGICTQAPS